jgi:DNA adenine methylase
MKRIRVSPFRKEIVLPTPYENSTPLIYYGGKSRDCDWILSHFPPHKYFCEVFGGGGAVTFRKSLVENNIYNDAGNVAVFWRVLQKWPEDLYQALYYTPYSREEFLLCANTWEQYAERSRETGEKEDFVEFARRWFVTIDISYSHREDDKSFKLAVQVNNALGFRNHVDSLPFVADRLRSIIIERLHFSDLIRLYDRDGMLLYCDPPYLPETRVSNGTYRREMSVDEHVQLLETINSCKSQVVLSGYDSKLYHDYLKDWRIVKKTMPSAIQNRAQLNGRSDRTEVIWVREDDYGLWSFLSDQDQSSPDVARIQDEAAG